MNHSISKLKLLASAFVFTAGTALAAVTPEQVAADYTAQGFTRVEIRTGPTQMKVEAIRGTEKLEVIIDTATGTVLKSETETVGAFENTRPGVSLRDRNRDFLRVKSSDSSNGDDNDDQDDDQSAGNDDGPGHDANDDSNDDVSGHDSTDDNDADQDDDHGGQSGSDDGEDDDHGGKSGHGGGDDDNDSDN